MPLLIPINISSTNGLSPRLTQESSSGYYSDIFRGRGGHVRRGIR